ncbi:MAG: hypothetical protein WC788_06655 [Candidatus Paceibacterota bacterium]|jgi:hypothetical protein
MVQSPVASQQNVQINYAAICSFPDVILSVMEWSEGSSLYDDENAIDMGILRLRFASLRMTT